MREILQARIHDPRTSARDLASLTNALARLNEEKKLESGPSLYDLRRGTLILEPEPEPEPGSGPERNYRLLQRVGGGIKTVADGLTNRQAWGLTACGLGLVTPEELDVSAESEP